MVAAKRQTVFLEFWLSRMQTIILDDHGRGWDAQSPTLRRFLHCPLPDFDFFAYLIENLGFVALTKVAPNAARIQFRPETASQTGIAAALYRVADMGLERIIISHPDHFVDRLFFSFAEAVAYIGEQLAAHHPQSSSAFRSRERSIELLANTNGPLPSLFQKWTYSNEVYNSATLATTLRETFLERFLVVEPIDGRLTIMDIGSGFESLGKTWPEHARGLPIEEQPDYDYGRWVQGMFCSVQETQQPRLDEVDARIRRPHRNDHIRVRYQRLILPFTYKRRAGTCLLSASVIDQTIDLSA
jgi:hypothetical protein